MDRTIDILLMTYNQEKYVLEAMEGIAMQRVDEDVKVRVIVADDCSTDGTMDIIKTFALKHKAEWVFLPNEKNLGIAGNYKRAIAATTGEYIAILEGDDYWTDAYRLQKHIDYLSTHADCVMTKNNYFEYHQRNSEWSLITSPHEYLFLRSNIYEYYLGNLSCSVFYGDVLRKIEEQIYEYGEKQRHEATDYYLTIAVLREGYGYVLKDAMSVYRVGTGTNFSLRNMTGEDYIAKSYLCYQQTYELLGASYKAECYKVYADTIRSVTAYNHAEKEKQWAEYLPPFVAHFIWNCFPPSWYWIKSKIRACVPNALHRKLKRRN